MTGIMMGIMAMTAVTSVTSSGLDAKTTWKQVSGLNACGNRCGCSGNACRDVPGFHYAGLKASADACQQTCQSDPTGKCAVWIYSKGSTHCWWRDDSKWVEEGSQSDVVSGCKSTVPSCGTDPNPPPKPAPNPPPSPPGPPTPFVPSQAANMNGEYKLSTTPKGQDASTKFPLNYKDYPGGVEYFDVYSPPIVSLYSQVFWTGLPPVDLPKDIVNRYAGKGMAVVGFETNQVMQTPEGEVQVPINVAYNHHFESGMSGARSKFVKVEFDGADDPKRLALMKDMGHQIPLSHHYVLEETAPSTLGIPTSQSFGAGNGGEYRKTFHGYAPGYVQVIESPEQFQFTPMQIDTWNRDLMWKNKSRPTKFFQGPEPRNSWAPAGGVDALYSGLLECPVTTRITKLMDMGYLTQESGTCGAAISTADECFSAALNTLGGVETQFVHNTGSSSAKPAGCSATADPADPALIYVYFNSAASDTSCGAGGAAAPVFGATQSLVRVAVTIDAARDNVTIELSGPADVWYGVGFNASQMKDAPWAIIVDGTGKVSERKLQDQSPGAEMTPSIKVVASTVQNGLRNVTLSRPLKGAGPGYYTFDAPSAAKLPFINAVGSGPALAFHKDKLPSQLSLLPGMAAPGTCICATKPIPFGAMSGKLMYNPTNQSADVGKGTISCCNRCSPEPRTDMLDQKNPTCDIRSYVGGQIACHHMFSLLDADQEIPWVEQPLNYTQKFRFWVQPYNASYHKTLDRVTWGIASPVEYDVPKCNEHVKGCAQTEDGNWIHTIKGTWKGNGKLIAAHFHCHAPTCLSVDMYRCPKGADNCDDKTGELICSEKPIYGGTGEIDEADFDEAGYIAVPPCLWGDSQFGLEPPMDTSGYTLHTIKTANATYGHHGEMAWQQMFFV